jgi:hypothetical protein
VFGSTNCGGIYGGLPVALGDVNGDQVPDFALSAASVVLPASHGGVGLVRVISGADFSTIYEVYGRPMPAGANREFLGAYLGGGHDINGDGVNDIVASGGLGSSLISAIIISGRTGQILYRARPSHAGGSLESGVILQTYPSTISDLDGDGYDDWAFTNYLADFGGSDSGRIIVLAGGPGDVEPVCDALPHSLGYAAQIQFYGAITEGNRGTEIQIDRAVPGGAAVVFYGARAPAVPLGAGQLCISPTSAVRYGGILPLDQDGRVQRSVEWFSPQLSQGTYAWTAGTSWTVQAIFRDAGTPSGLNTTNAIEVTFNQ